MTDTTAGKLAEDIVRAALTLAGSYAARAVRLSSEGISFSDWFGTRREAIAKTGQLQIDIGTMSEVLGSSRFSTHNWRSDKEERRISGHGIWIMSEDDDAIVLKPKKAMAPCLEALFSADAEDLAKFRSLYRRGGMDVFFVCEGDTRTRDVALALAAERNVIGLPTRVSLPAIDDGYGRQETALEQQGPDMFERVFSEGGQFWNIEQVTGKYDHVNRFRTTSDSEETHVTVVSVSHWNAGRFLKGARQTLGERDRPAVVVAVRLEDSVPTARFAFAPALDREASIETGFENTPWDIFAEKRAARLKSRPPDPKTWHPTTGAVAKAFLERKAPRGFVSGKSIYFHGPVAFSIYDGNPIAALVDLPGGRTAILYGRDDGIGGTMAGTVSSAQGDIRDAARDKGFLEYGVGNLTAFLTLGDVPIDQVAWRIGKQKKEAEYPSSCRIDLEKLRTWFLDQFEEHEIALAEAMETPFPTHKKASRWADLAALAEQRDGLSAYLGEELPDVGVAFEYRRRSRMEQLAAEERQREMKERRRQQQDAARAVGEDEPAEDGAAFQM